MKKIEIKQVINDYCEEKGLSKAAFAIKCGVSEATLSAIENEKWQNLSEEIIQKIMSFINRVWLKHCTRVMISLIRSKPVTRHENTV